MVSFSPAARKSKAPSAFEKFSGIVPVVTVALVSVIVPGVRAPVSAVTSAADWSPVRPVVPEPVRTGAATDTVCVSIRSTSVKLRLAVSVTAVVDPVVAAASVKMCVPASAASIGASLVPVIVKVMSFVVPSSDVTVNTSFFG
ncbi:hypothetical protein AFCDBAGC_3902 [Methylobacterium cerastii]|uniref:Uncharacterized protein n=1 Tax=Methylobacterium cerastii TaxID=932741 RepID=A0ABQ4QLI5_9HYPH|nr:hypothetical protein AFCDBAGC_3902 [Methylobacterium cerastii]